MAQGTETTGDGSMHRQPTTALETPEGPRVVSRRIAPRDAVRPHRRRWWWWLFGAAVVAGGVALWTLSNNESEAAGTAAASTVSFADVVLADLIQEESYDGTLGAIPADPIRTQLAGTLTSVAEAGSTLGEGDVLFTVDEQPVVLLQGSLPAYRDMALAEGTVTGLSNRLSGTVTRVAEAGVFAQGDILYWVDEQPVVLLYGDLPQYRTIALPRMGTFEGPDVAQLKEALVALGYDPDGTVVPGETFGGKAEAMVERWQADIGASEDGSVGVGEVIYASGPVEVTDFLIEVGDTVAPGQDVAELPDDDVEPLQGGDVQQFEEALVRLGFGSGALVADGIWDESTDRATIAWQESMGAEADGIVDWGDVVFLPDTISVLDQLATKGTTVNGGTGVLDVSSAEKLVSMDLPGSDQGVVSVGDTVTVELPDGTVVPATVVDVPTVATGTGNNAVFPVTIALDDPSAAEGLDEAPVEVMIVTDSARGVMAVPVTSLLALAEGGYAVEVDAGGGNTRLVGVEIGFFADGLVEVQSSGLHVGDRVVIP